MTVKKAVILAGGLGTRLSEETVIKPKPLVEIGSRPILWHIMKLYYHAGISEFIVCLGYKGYLIKEYFSNYFLHQSDVTFDFTSNSIEYHQKRSENWKVTLIDTGADTMTGGRIKKIRDYIGSETFCLTYGDGVSDVNISDLVNFHNNHGKIGTVTAVSPPGRFGALKLDETQTVSGFHEKPLGDGGRINGGFFVLNPDIFGLISDDTTVFEREPLEALASRRELAAYQHDGFWHPMDTLRDKSYLETLWASGNAPWKLWP
jgi:glucose-1-phosphate cytidylyltransferase